MPDFSAGLSEMLAALEAKSAELRTEDTGAKYLAQIELPSLHPAQRKLLAESNTLLAQYAVDLERTELDFKWFGSAPFCDAQLCDLLVERYFPIAYDSSGDGSECKTGSKILGARPVGAAYASYQFPNYNEMYAECQRYLNATAESKLKILENITTMAKDALAAMLSPAPTK